MVTKKAFLVVAGLYWLLGMHFFMHNPGGSGLYLPFNMLGWAFVSVLIGLGLWLVASSGRLLVSRAQLWLLLGFGVLLIPLAAHVELSVDAGAPRLLGMAAGLLLLMALTQLCLSRSQRLLMLYLLLGAVAVEALFALVQYYLLQPGNWIGYNTLVNRPYGIFQQPNALASFMALGLGIALYLALRDPQAMMRRWRLLLIAGSLLMTSLLVTVVQSRAGWIGASVVGLVFLSLLWQQKVVRRSWLLLAVLLGISLGAISQWSNVNAGTGFERPLEQLVGKQLRTIYWTHSLEMIAKRPLLGVGYGRFESAFVDDYYRVPPSISGAPLIEQNLDHPHNELLYWLVEGGLVALLGLALMAWGWWRMLAPHRWSKRLALFALPFPLLFHAMVEYPFYHSLAHWLALTWLFWFTDAEGERYQEYHCRTPFLFKVVALLIPLVTVPFMLTGLQGAYWVTRFERDGMRDLALLDRVINPIPWYSRYKYDVMTIRLTQGLANRHPDELIAYVEWARDFVTLSPRSNVYFNAALALDVLGRHEEATQWRQNGVHLFPADPLFNRPAVVDSEVSAATSAGAAHQ